LGIGRNIKQHQTTMNFFKNLFAKKINNLELLNPENSVKLEDTTAQVVEKIYISKKTNKISPVKNNSTLSEERKEELIEMAAKDALKQNNNDDNFDFNNRDPFFDEAARLLVSHQQSSTSLIQRRLKLGYNRAGRLIDQLESAGIVGIFQESSGREVLVKSHKDLENYFNTGVLIYNLDVDVKQFLEENKEQIEKRKIELQRLIEEEELNNEKEQIRLKLLQEKEQIRLELLEKDRKRKLQKEVLKTLIENGEIFNEFNNEDTRREPIPQDVMDKVWNRDKGKCVQCGNQEHLEFDHIIPFSKGGATTYRNLQILCKKCNIEKSNKIG
jgi:Ftsk gamma domain/HNH endonuclease